jgi:CRP-like cAMP-binding protein
MEIISTLLCIDIFRHMSLAKVRQFLGIVRREHHSAGAYVFEQGDPGERFYIVVRGRVEIREDGRLLTTYADGDYFGDKALFLEERRTASVLAQTDLILLSIDNRQMRAFIRGTEMEANLRALALLQNQELREMLDQSPLLRRLTPTQKTQLHQSVQMVDEHFPVGTTFLREEQPGRYCYFIRSGSVDANRKNLTRGTLMHGDLFGVAALLSEHGLSHFSFIAREPVELARIPADAFLEFVGNNPGVYASLFFYDY